MQSLTGEGTVRERGADDSTQNSVYTGLIFGMEDLASSPTVPEPSQFWQPMARRHRKSGSPNIFRDVNLRQLQRLFRRAGDQDAEQRAQLVWSHSDAADLTQALIALRTRGRRSRVRGEGSKWLQAFGHLRINEASVETPVPRINEASAETPVPRINEALVATASDGDLEAEPTSLCIPESTLNSMAGGQGGKPLAEGRIDLEQLQNAPVSSLRNRLGVVNQGRERNPERYLHRILH
ncbi:hypothetical protein GJAV_G00150040 [Gymnothorax javanicus]|nr:hypothetical protein GJAV_G00150040 [Gymnothorax javanicus]